ncbi:MAG: hypothetical protein R2792_00990 [Saprospiraceae bacterium]
MPRRKQLEAANTNGTTNRTGPGLPPIVLMLVFASIAGLLMPYPAQFPYTYAMGQPWNHPTLKAPFSYLLEENPDAYEDASQQVFQDQTPCFIRDEGLEAQSSQQFDELFNEQQRISRDSAFLSNPEPYQQTGQALLNQVYAAGILPNNSPLLSQMPLESQVYIFTKQGRTETTFQKVYTEQSARDFFIDTLPYTKLQSPEILLPVLQQSVSPNLFYSDSLTKHLLQKQLNAIPEEQTVVPKGSIIIQQNELVDQDAFIRLESLKKQGGEQPFWKRYIGYALLALLGFAALWLLVLQYAPLEANSGLRSMLLPLTMLSGLALLKFAVWASPTAVLFLPFYAVPLLFAKRYEAPISLAAGGLLIVLSGIALPWGESWIFIQALGLISTWLFLLPENKWPQRLAASAANMVVLGIVWFALGILGKLPELIWQNDALLVLACSALIALLAFPLQSLFPPMDLEEQNDKNHTLS